MDAQLTGGESTPRSPQEEEWVIKCSLSGALNLPGDRKHNVAQRVVDIVQSMSRIMRRGSLPTPRMIVIMQGVFEAMIEPRYRKKEPDPIERLRMTERQAGDKYKLIPPRKVLLVLSHLKAM